VCGQDEPVILCRGICSSHIAIFNLGALLTVSNERNGDGMERAEEGGKMTISVLYPNI